MTALTVSSPGAAAGGPAGDAARGPLRGAWLALYLPALVLLGLCFVFPLVELLLQSFRGETAPLDNYRELWESEVFGAVLWRTFATSAVVCLVCLALGYPYAYLMTVASPRWRDIMLVIVLVPLWTSTMVRTFSWLVLLQDNGVINDGLAALGVDRLPLVRNTAGVTIGMSQVMLPFAVLPIYSIMQKIDRRLLAAAAACGARPAAAFLRIYVPLSMPGVLAGMSLVFVLSLGFFITPQMLGSPSNALLSQLLYTQMTQLGDGGLAAAMGFVLLVATLLVMLVMQLLRSAAAKAGRL